MDAASVGALPDGELSESGMGLAIIHALVDRVEIGTGQSGRGTVVPHAASSVDPRERLALAIRHGPQDRLDRVVDAVRRKAGDAERECGA